jgi:choline dehydrogenase/5-(hydroxymethyl)furfural/furfural oxidase
VPEHRPAAADVVIVGAGTAGCVLAAALSEEPQRRVVLIDAGPAGADPALVGMDYLAGAGPGRFWEEGLVERVAGQPPRPYRSGRGVGGSAAVNGMVVVAPPAEDLAAWPATGCPSWTADAIAPAMAPVAAGWTATPAGELGSLELALERAAAVTGAGAGTFTPVALERAGDHRASVAERLLVPASRRPNLTLITGAAVHHVAVDGARATGVVLDDGSTIESAEIVLSAGAIRSPGLLAASGLAHVLAGGRLSDHPSGTFTLHLRDEITARFQTCGALRWRTACGAIAELLPIARVGEGLAALTLGIMDPTSTGAVLAAPDADRVVARLGMLDDARDRTAMGEAIGDTLRLLATPPFARLVARVSAGALGIEATDLLDAGDDTLDAWVAATGPLLHAGCSLPLGAVLDEHGRVPDVAGLRVIDASVLPVLPTVAPNGTVSVVAAHLGATWSDATRANR